MSPYSTGCVVLNQAGASSAGIYFKLSNNQEFGAPYAQLQFVWYNDPDEVVVVFSASRVVVKGKRLEPLLEHIIQHRVRVIRTAARNELLQGVGDGGTEPLVESIKVEDKD